MKKKLMVMLIAALLAVPATVFAVAGVLDDEVTSIKLKEADGTSGQDTNSGSGVKTGHIQDGAVTDIKITGPISASKISSVGLDADTVDGQHASDFASAAHVHAISDVSGLQTSLDGKADVLHQHPELQKKCANVVVVANSGGDFTDLNQAINSITDASIDNPYLIKIMPGVYGISTTINTKPYVDVDGSGVNMTKINYLTSDYGFYPAFAIVPFSKLSNLTIELSTSVSVIWGVSLAGTISDVNINKSGQGGFIGIIKDSYYPGSDILIDDVKMSAACDNYDCTGIRLVSSYQQNVTVNNFDFVATGPINYQIVGIYAAGYNNFVFENGKIEVPSSSINVGFFASGGTMDINNLSINAGSGKGVQVSNEGIYAFRNSKITGTSSSIQNDYSSVNLVNSQIAGPIQTTGQVKCISIFDENFSPLTCQ